MTVAKPNITGLEEAAAKLPAAARTLFQRLYAVTASSGELRLPPAMRPWVKRQFGSLDAVTSQKIVRVTNLITYEESLFNRQRASRPIETRETKSLDARLLEASENDSFAHPEETTPEDLFGRITGRHCVTASNIAKYDGRHGMVIFNDFNPLKFSREQVVDYIDVAQKWALKAGAEHPPAKYFFFCWNCLWRAGASIYHGHAHVLLASGRHYARIEKLRQAALDYRQRFGSDYFNDLFQVHRSLGCAIEKEGVKILAYLTPFRDNEIVLMAEGLNLSLKERIYEVLAFLRDKMGTTSFNLSLTTPPLAETEESWQGFPAMARVIDRGNPDNSASDIGGIEIYAASVVSSDPFELARGLERYLG